MICLLCNKAAEHTEDYQGIPIGTCEDGHRTGLSPRGMVQETKTYIDWDDETEKAS